jgi:sulfur carrier protein ThiS
MNIHIILVGSLRDKLPKQAKGRTRLTLAEGATVAQAIDALNLSPTTTAAVGGVTVDKGHVLQEGDELQLFRMVGGGCDHPIR